MKMKILEKINNYLNESKIPTQMIDKVVKYLEQKFPYEGLQVAWFDGKNWYSFNYEDGIVKNEYISKKFENLGIGSEDDWPADQYPDLAKVLRAKKAYIMNL